MIYRDAARTGARAAEKRVLLFGMSGLGKTRLSALLRGAGGWFHYSIDYRIGTRYMGEHIADNFKREAMKNPFLAAAAAHRFRSISRPTSPSRTSPRSRPISASPAIRPGAACRSPNTAAARPSSAAPRSPRWPITGTFIDRAETVYGYPHFVCDTGGSICEWVDPDDPADPLLTQLAAATPDDLDRRQPTRIPKS